MKLNLKDAEVLLLIYQDNIVRKSAFGKGSTKILEAMISFGALKQKQITKNSYEISLGRKESFDGYLSSYLHIEKLNDYIKALKLQNPSRSELSELGVSTKLKSTNPKSGIHINSPDALMVAINDEEVTLSYPKGCALFVHKDSDIALREDVLIVGVENFENISGKLKKRDIFPEEKIIFIERNRVLQNLLAEVPNRYLHFGDIDLAGISIYQNEYEYIVKERGSFFIPENIELLLKKGVLDTYLKQEKKYTSLAGNTEAIQTLIKLIRTHKRVIEQEYFLE